MFSRFFIDRPIFASVLSIVVTLVGALAYAGLPVAQFPDVVPPTPQTAAQAAAGLEEARRRAFILGGPAAAS